MRCSEGNGFVFREKVCIFAVGSDITESRLKANKYNPLTGAEQRVDFLLAMEFMMDSRAEILFSCYNVFEVLAQQIFCPEPTL